MKRDSFPRNSITILVATFQTRNMKLQNPKSFERSDRTALHVSQLPVALRHPFVVIHMFLSWTLNCRIRVHGKTNKNLGLSLANIILLLRGILLTRGVKPQRWKDSHLRQGELVNHIMSETWATGPGEIQFHVPRRIKVKDARRRKCFLKLVNKKHSENQTPPPFLPYQFAMYGGGGFSRNKEAPKCKKLCIGLDNLDRCEFWLSKIIWNLT